MNKSIFQRTKDLVKKLISYNFVIAIFITFIVHQWIMKDNTILDWKIVGIYVLAMCFILLTRKTSELIKYYYTNKDGDK